MATELCPHTVGCEMFELFQLKGALRVWQINYCESSYERCARHRAAASGAHVAPDLLPNGKHLTMVAAVEKK